MPKKKYNVALSSEEENLLNSITHIGNKYSAREILHAQVLLHSNDNKPALKKDNREIAEWFGISPTTVNQIRKSYSEIDSEYICCGTASIFMFTEPLGKWRHVSALERRTKGDYAKMMK